MSIASRKKLLSEFCDFLNINKNKIDLFLLNTNTNTNAETNISENRYVVYTDGACSSNGKLNSTAGIGIYFENSKKEISQNLETVFNDLFPDLKVHKFTNQQAELLAILKAILATKNKYYIHIKTDSMYSINCINKWYMNWEKNGWKTANGKLVMNQEIIKEILKYSKNNDKIKISYTPAHKPEPTDKTKYKDWFGNKEADRLACEALHL